jgi:hypothetical protein
LAQFLKKRLEAQPLKDRIGQRQQRISAQKGNDACHDEGKASFLEQLSAIPVRINAEWREEMEDNRASHNAHGKQGPETLRNWNQDQKPCGNLHTGNEKPEGLFRNT